MQQWSNIAGMYWQSLRPIVQGLVLGVAIGATLVTAAWWPVAVLAVVLLYVQARTETPAALVVTGVGYSVGKMAMALAAMASAYPFEWLPHVSAGYALLTTGMIFLITCVTLGVAGVLLGVTAMSIWRQHIPWCLPLVFSITLLSMDVAGSVVFSVLSFGGGNGLAAAFSFGYLGYSVATWPGFLDLAYLGGVYALSLGGVLVVSSVVEVMVWQTGVGRRYMVRAGVVVSVGLVLVIAASMPQPTADEPISVALVGTTITDSVAHPTTWWKEHHERLALLVAAVDTEYVILPEDSRLLSTVYGADVVGWDEAYVAYQLLQPTEAVVIDSGVYRRPDALFELRGFVLASTAPLAMAAKEYLVPYGEYQPRLAGLFFDLLGKSYITDALDAYFAFRPGQVPNPQTQIPLMFCFESVKPWWAWQHTTAETLFIAHPVSHARFHQPDRLWYQLDTMLRIQAMWAGVPIVTAANMAMPKVYMPSGDVHIPTPTVADSYGNSIAEVQLSRY